MKLEQSFVIRRPPDAVWKAFQDIPAMAECLPGASLTEDRGNGVYAGRMQAKLGPFSASFDGEATVATDAAKRTGHVEAKGVDKRGGSRSRLVVDYTVTPEGPDTRVALVADVALSGPVAQFGRTGLVTETSNLIIREFVSTLEAKLAAATPEEAAAVQASEVRGFSLFFAAFKAWIAKLFGRMGG